MKRNATTNTDATMNTANEEGKKMTKKTTKNTTKASATKKTTTKKEDKNMTTATENTTPATVDAMNTENKEENTMAAENTQEVKKEEEVKKAEPKKAEIRASKKDEIMKAADKWLADYAARTPGAEVKIWPATPNNRKLVVNGKAFYEIIISCNGIFLNGKSEYIPEDQRPAGSYIVKNGLDLCMKELRPEDLEKYTTLCEQAVAAKKAEKEKAEAAKKEAAAKAKAEKEAARKAAKEAKEKAKAEAKAKKEQEKAAKKTAQEQEVKKEETKAE